MNRDGWKFMLCTVATCLACAGIYVLAVFYEDVMLLNKAGMVFRNLEALYEGRLGGEELGFSKDDLITAEYLVGKVLGEKELDADLRNNRIIILPHTRISSAGTAVLICVTPRRCVVVSKGGAEVTYLRPIFHFIGKSSVETGSW